MRHSRVMGHPRGVRSLWTGDAALASGLSPSGALRLAAAACPQTPDTALRTIGKGRRGDGRLGLPGVCSAGV